MKNIRSRNARRELAVAIVISAILALEILGTITHVKWLEIAAGIPLAIAVCVYIAVFTLAICEGCVRKIRGRRDR